MPNTKRSREQDWFTPFRSVQSATLAPDERVAMVMHYEVENTLEKKTTHTIFAVVRKGDKAIARSIMSHGNGVGYCAGHADDIAEYPIENCMDLVNEVRDHALMMAVMLIKETNLPLKIDMNKPVFYVQTPTISSNSELLAKFGEDTQEEGKIPKQVIASVLGLGEVPATPEMTMKVTPEEHNGVSHAQRLQKAAIENDLIKRFGKKKIVDLAKSMNYEGETINKIKTKTHVNNKS